MSQIRLIARVVAQDGKQEQVRAALRAIIAPSRAEPGNRYYEIYESHEGHRFLASELWESEAALDAHFATPHSQRLNAELKPLIVGEVEINLLHELESLT